MIFHVVAKLTSCPFCESCLSVPNTILMSILGIWHFLSSALQPPCDLWWASALISCPICYWSVNWVFFLRKFCMFYPAFVNSLDHVWLKDSCSKGLRAVSSYPGVGSGGIANCRAHLESGEVTLAWRLKPPQTEWKLSGFLWPTLKIPFIIFLVLLWESSHRDQ